MFDKITIFTCWYNINNKYNYQTYMNWLPNFLGLNINMVIYTDIKSKSILESFREERNTHYIIREIEDFQVYKYLPYWEHCEKIDIEKGGGHNKYLYMVWNERSYHWIDEVATLNPFKSDFICWTDMGIIRDKDMLPHITGFPINILNLEKDKFLVSQVDKFNPSDYQIGHGNILNCLQNLNNNYSCHVINRIQGGFFGGRIQECKKFSSLYKQHLHSFINTKTFAGKDQYILINLVITNPLFFSIIPPFDPKIQCISNWSSFLITAGKGPLITVQIQGGLGNQLFQIATTYAIAYKNKGKPVFLKNKPIGITDRPLYWDTLFKKCSSYEKLNDNFVEIHENWNHVFTNFNINKSVNTKLVGYFQTSKYFNEYKSEILSLFSPHHQLNFSMLKPNMVAIHIRRGDYVKLNWTLPISYYINCINKILDNVTFVIFSDDINWCKQNLITDRPLLFNEDGNDIEQLFLMSKMDGMICSNSSYSWWAAYLSTTHKYVYAPNPWLKNENYNPEIYENTWIKVDV